MGTYIGSGAGRFTGKGSAVSFRGAIYYQGASGKLAPLNGLALVYEWDVDDNGNGQFNWPMIARHVNPFPQNSPLRA